MESSDVYCQNSLYHEDVGAHKECQELCEQLPECIGISFHDSYGWCRTCYDLGFANSTGWQLYRKPGNIACPKILWKNSQVPIQVFGMACYIPYLQPTIMKLGGFSWRDQRPAYPGLLTNTNLTWELADPTAKVPVQNSLPLKRIIVTAARMME